MITLENAHVTTGILNTIRYWQEEDFAGLNEDIKAIDDAVAFIACERDNPGISTDRELLTIIAALSFLKRRLCLFDGEEGNTRDI